MNRDDMDNDNFADLSDEALDAALNEDDEDTEVRDTIDDPNTHPEVARDLEAAIAMDALDAKSFENLVDQVLDRTVDVELESSPEAQKNRDDRNDEIHRAWAADTAAWVAEQKDARRVAQAKLAESLETRPDPTEPANHLEDLSDAEFLELTQAVDDPAAMKRLSRRLGKPQLIGPHRDGRRLMPTPLHARPMDAGELREVVRLGAERAKPNWNVDADGGGHVTTTTNLYQPQMRCTRCKAEANVLSMGPAGGERLCLTCSPSDIIALAESDRCETCHQELPLTHA